MDIRKTIAKVKPTYISANNVVSRTRHYSTKLSIGERRRHRLNNLRVQLSANHVLLCKLSRVIYSVYIYT